jgi:hypothetical protein
LFCSFLCIAGILQAKAGDFMRGKKIFILLGLLALIATTGGLVWFWWPDAPPKTPLRSRSVKIEYRMPAIAELSTVRGMESS